MATSTTDPIAQGAAHELRIGILGPLEVRRGTSVLALGGRQQRAVLALLVLDRGRTVSVDRIADAVWGDRPPPGYVTTVQTYVFHLRAALEPDRPKGGPAEVLVSSAGGGYRLDVPADCVDVARFDDLVARGRAAMDAGDPSVAMAHLSQALALWRGDVLAGLSELDGVEPVAARLTEAQLTASEDWATAALALGQHGNVVPDLVVLTDAHPLRERLWALRMVALYRSGRQADALAAYQDVRRMLDDQLGVQPSQELRTLHERILRQDRALDPTSNAALPILPRMSTTQPETAAALTEPGTRDGSSPKAGVDAGSTPTWFQRFALRRGRPASASTQSVRGRSGRWLIPSTVGVGAVALVAVLVLILRGGGENGRTITDLATTGGALDRPVAVAIGPGGTAYVAEHNQVVSIDRSGVIAAFAGGATAGSAGDGAAATQAHLNSPQALAVDDLGNVYIADTGNNRVRRVTPDGTISTVAGNGTAAFSGEGGPAVDASLNAPAGLAIGFGRTLYVADSGNNRVRHLNTDGTLRTIAGVGDPAYAGDGSKATAALLNGPEGLAFDHEGNLFIADSLNDRIRQVDPSGTITTIAGDGHRDFRGDGATARLASLNMAAGPGTGGAIAVDDAGRLYLADGLNNRIRVIDLSGVISTVAGNGDSGYAGNRTSALASELNLPLGVAIDASGRVYIADTMNSLVRILR